MKNKCLVFLLVILLLSPSYLYSQQSSLSEQIEAEVIELENLKKNYQEAEERLEIVEQNLENAEESLAKVNQDLMALSKDYEQSQRKLKFWRTSAIVAIPISIITGLVVGICINDK